MRPWLIIGSILVAVLAAGGFLALGDPERRPVPTIELRVETTVTGAADPTEEPREQERRTGSGGATRGSGGSGASPAPAPAPAPAGNDSDDDDDDDDRDETSDDDD